MERLELERELERLHDESWGWALSCCERDREQAEEVLQTAYVRILSERARFGGRSTVKSWVFGVIRTIAREEHRRRIRSPLPAAPDAGEVVDPAPGADAAAEAAELRDALVAALNAVSPRQREVLQLVFYHGLTIEEAARVMKVSLGSARTHYERGKKAVAGRLATEHAR